LHAIVFGIVVLSIALLMKHVRAVSLRLLARKWVQAYQVTRIERVTPAFWPLHPLTRQLYVFTRRRECSGALFAAQCLYEIFNRY